MVNHLPHKTQKGRRRRRTTTTTHPQKRSKKYTLLATRLIYSKNRIDLFKKRHGHPLSSQQCFKSSRNLFTWIMPRWSKDGFFFLDVLVNNPSCLKGSFWCCSSEMPGAANWQSMDTYSPRNKAWWEQINTTSEKTSNLYSLSPTCQEPSWSIFFNWRFHQKPLTSVLNECFFPGVKNKKRTALAR